MLLIGDIHINARHSLAIIDSLKSFTDKFSDEKNIVFLGDFMYMFSYDRQALGDLFDFFLELSQSDKNVYIMSGNHDWLNQHFVYHEGKKVADILNRQAGSKLHFITEPEVHTIEGKEILFMPYNKAFLGNYLTLYQSNTSLTGDSSLRSEGREIIKQDTAPLLESKNYNEQLSGALNHYLLANYKPGMVLMHHYYTADTSFPGQQAKFNYKDISLHSLWPKYADKVISGHLHKAFVHEHYLCVGSVWSTTSGERNQSKFLRKWDTAKDRYEAIEIAINPYLSIESAGDMNIDAIEKQISENHREHAALLPEIQITSAKPDLAKTSVIVYSNKSVEEIEKIVDPALKAIIGDIQLKQTSAAYKDMTELLDISQYNVQQSLLDRKELVKKYLMSRYPEGSEKYRNILSELNIL